MPKPWTDDEILQTVFFTNPYRELDKVTVWFRQNIRDPLRDSPEVLFATVAFRWFNFPHTAMVLMGNDRPSNSPKSTGPFRFESWGLGNLFIAWDPQEALERLSDVRKREGMGNGSGQIFTGAYMINSPAGKPKLEAIIERVDQVWQRREEIVCEIMAPHNGCTLQEAHKLLMQFPGMGGFMSYEVVCDLRYTYLLGNAPDILTWANPGPGAIRGICRLLNIDFPKGKNSHGFTPSVKFDFCEEAQKIRKVMENQLRTMPRFEMREVEHSLCEFDKYERVLWNDGRPKRMYNGKA